MLVPTEYILLVLFFSLSTRAVYVLNEISFGQNNKIASENGLISNFKLLGSPNLPEVLSNKIVLTPPSPGNTRGAIWSITPLTQNYWKIDIELRASGPERASGNIQIWYVKDGQETVGTASIYTVGNFDGLVLIIDQYAGSGGSIRAFLNDGTTNYKSHHNVDSLALIHCDYSYRNLGRPSRITFSQISSGFYIFIDGKDCLASSNISLAPGNNLGITAASADTPDSIEVYKLVTTVENPSSEKTPQQKDGSQQTAQKVVEGSYQSAKVEEKSIASNPKLAEQFLDVKFQIILEQLNKIQQTMVSLQTQYTTKQQELSDRLRPIELKMNNIDLFSENLQDVKKGIIFMKDELHKTLEQHMSGLQTDVKEAKKTLLNTHLSLHGHLSWIGTFLKYSLVILAIQAMLIFGFMTFKQRKANKPKKFM